MSIDDNSGGRPSPDELQAKYSKQLEYEEDEDNKVSELQKNLRDKFRYGVRRLCVARAWDEIERFLESSSPTKLARLTNVNRNQIYLFREGDIPTTNLLYAILSDVRAKYKDLGQMPSLSERVLEGYRSAVYWYQSGKNLPFKNRDDLGISFDQLHAVLSADKVIHEQRLPVILLPDDWIKIANSINSQVKKETTRELEPNVLQRWFRKWGEPVTKVRNAIPYAWKSETNKNG